MIPDEVLQAQATKMVKQHIEIGWDLWPELVAYTWDGNELRIAMIAMIDGRIHPDQLPRTLISTIMNFRSESPDTKIAAVSFTFEGYGVIQPRDDASDKEKSRFEKDRMNRTFHERGDRQEMAMTVICDGSTIITATSQIIRGENEDQPREHIIYPGDDSAVGGRMINAVQSAAALAAINEDRLSELIQLAKSGHGIN